MCVQGTALYLGVGVLCAVGHTEEGTAHAFSVCAIDLTAVWATAVGIDTPVADRAPALRLLHLASRYRVTCGLLAAFEPDLHKVISLLANGSLFIS